MNQGYPGPPQEYGYSGPSSYSQAYPSTQPYPPNNATIGQPGTVFGKENDGDRNF